MSSSLERTLSREIPLEGTNLIIDLISTDDRPTFILEQKDPPIIVSSAAHAPVSFPAHYGISTPPRLVFRNAALETFIRISDKEDALSFHTWISTLAVKRNEKNERRASCAQYAGVFGGRDWLYKSLACGWLVVYCEGHDWCARDSGHRGGSIATGIESTPDERERKSEAEDAESVLTESRPVSAVLRRTTEEINHTIAEGQLCDITVDWIQYPSVATSPWIDFLRNFAWEKTAIGPMHSWPPILRSLVVTITGCPEPRCLFWGNDLILLYNEAAVATIAENHPASLGAKLADVWGQDIYNHHCQAIRSGINVGIAPRLNKVEMVLDVDGVSEESYHNLHFMPIVAEDGSLSGAIQGLTDVTAMVFQENRVKVNVAVGEQAAKAQSLPQLWSGFLQALEAESQDVSYAIVYTVEHLSPIGPSIPLSSSTTNDTPRLSPFRYYASFGMENTPLSAASPLSLSEAFQKAQDGITLLETKSGTLPPELAVATPRGIVSAAYVVPITSTIGAQLAYVMLGMNPRRPIEEGYLFVTSLRDLVARSAALARLPEERRRIEEANLALLDQQRLARVKAEKNAEVFERLSRNAPVGMFVLNPDGSPKYCNDAYLKIFGMKREEFFERAKSGWAWSNVFSDEDLKHAKNTLHQLVIDKQSASYEYQIHGVTSAPFWVDGTSFPEVDENGTVVSIQGWLRDVSHRKVAESIKDARLQDALETKRATERFLDMISHEIRNPLSSILQLADGIITSLPLEVGDGSTLSTDTLATIKDGAETIVLCATHQKNVVDEVLTLSKLDSNLLVLALERTHAPAIVETGLKMFAADLIAAKIQTFVTIERSYTDIVTGDVLLDSSRLLQVVINLLTNAIKFTRDSEIRRITISIGASLERPTGEEHPVTFIPVRIKDRTATKLTERSTTPHLAETPATDKDIYLHFNITDTGAGLTADEMQHLFHRFSQASPRTYKQYGGSGLGLFISRELTELHGGQIGVGSEPGAGTTFMFYVRSFLAETVPCQLKTDLHEIGDPASLAPHAKLPRRGPNYAGAKEINVGNLHVLGKPPCIDHGMSTSQLTDIQSLRTMPSTNA